MDKAVVLSRLKAHERELRDLGVASLSIFGSTARDEAGPESDVDLAATFSPEANLDLFDFADISARLHDWLNVSVDLVGEPARKPRLQIEIDKDRVRVF